MIASLIGLATMIAVAVWRFAKLEVAVKNDHQCNRLLIKAVSRTNLRVSRLTKTLETHIEGES